MSLRVEMSVGSVVGTGSVSLESGGGAAGSLGSGGVAVAVSVEVSLGRGDGITGSLGSGVMAVSVSVEVSLGREGDGKESGSISLGRDGVWRTSCVGSEKRFNVSSASCD